jgi:hypothetical protein
VLLHTYTNYCREHVPEPLHAGFDFGDNNNARVIPAKNDDECEEEVEDNSDAEDYYNQFDDEYGSEEQ